METKRIQLRGISRSPSDKMTEDGGCAESLNAYIDNEEVAPVVVPKDITDSVQMPEDTNVVSMFIHNTSNKKNYIWIAKTGDEPYHILAIHPETNKPRAIVTLDNNEELNDIASVGNTLIVSGSNKVYYILFKDNQYSFIGNYIPVPTLEIKPHFYRSHPHLRGRIDSTIHSGYEEPTGLATGSVELWQDAITNGSDELLEFQNKFWEGLQKGMLPIAKAGLFSYPVFIRYAVRLYDGSYVNHSVPILLGAGYRRYINCYLHTATTTEGASGTSSGGRTQYLTQIRAKLNDSYKIDMMLYDLELENWSDIVSSIDVFISEPVTYPTFNSDFAWVSEVDGEKVVSLGYETDTDIEEKAIKDNLLSKSLFYKIESYAVGNLAGLKSGVIISNSEDYYLTEKLYVKETLPDEFRSNHHYAFKNLTSFNGRLLANGITETLSPGSNIPNALIKTERISDTADPVRFIDTYYEIVDSTGKHCFVKGHGLQTNALTTPLLTDSYIPMGSSRIPTGENMADRFYYSALGGFVVYPDTRCVAMYFRNNQYNPADDYDRQWKKVEMLPHPLLNCSYAYLGLDVIMTSVEDLPTVSTIPNEDNMTSAYLSDYLFVSNVDNPFFFPAEGRKKIGSNIIDTAVASVALSQGQFGQFPLYVFTEDGIWAMETATDGSLLSIAPLSRDVCINPKSIASIDQAIVFVTEKGVMLLQGSSISNLSPNMNGRHYVIEPTAQTIIEGIKSEFTYLKDGYSDNTAFMAFIKDARIAYDYPGKRLVFFNEKEKYQYVYKLDTSTWHKIMHEACTFPTPLNSYPRCEVLTFTAEGEPHVLDFSTILDSSEDQTTERVIVATRPFDLGEPDVFKTIKDVRVRGNFAKKAVSLILQGSQDGINFFTISTLRGKAWKMFRIIVLADLTQHERISWIDVGYETRFTNRLR